MTKTQRVQRAFKAALAGAVLGLFAGMAHGADETAAFRNTSLPIDQRVDDLISTMTLEEKALALYHKAPAIPRVGIPYWGGWNQCLHGIWSARATTEYPVSIAAAATWDTDLVHTEAVALSDEARALYNMKAPGINGPHGLVYRGPVINISRDPRWGRIQECYGEDPWLAGRLAVAYVKGLQGDDPKYIKIASTLKHFTVNNRETGRKTSSETVPERMLYEYYLPHFKAGIVEGGASSIMAAYNGINGVPCAMNHWLLTDVLKTDWGFQGFVVSDLGGVGLLMTGQHVSDKPEVVVADALNAGCDFDDEQYRDAIPTAVKQGLVSEDVVNAALHRVLRIAFRLGAFDPAGSTPWEKLGAEQVNSDEHRQLALKIARESMVLLQNKNNFLPLDPAKLKTVAVIGPVAQTPEYGNYFGRVPPMRVGPLDGLKKRLGAGVTVNYVKGCDVLPPRNQTADTRAAAATEIENAVAAAKSADAVILCLGTTLAVEAEDRDRANTNLPGAQEQLLEAVTAANPRTVVVLLNAGPLPAKWAVDHAPAMLEAWYPGEEGGTAIAETLFGDINPAGRLPYTVYESVAEVPPMSEYDISKGFTYMYYKGTPTFAFGHGLSYTTFAYSHLQLGPATMNKPSGGSFGGPTMLSVSVDVQNTGARAGDEVVQLYTHQAVEGLPMPAKKLAGFQRVMLAAGEKKTVTMAVRADQLQYYDEKKHAFASAGSAVDIMVGGASDEIKLTTKQMVQQVEWKEPGLK